MRLRMIPEFSKGRGFSKNPRESIMVFDAGKMKHRKKKIKSFLILFVISKVAECKFEEGTLQSHYNATHYKMVLDITRPCLGSQMVIFI